MRSEMVINCDISHPKTNENGKKYMVVKSELKVHLEGDTELTRNVPRCSNKSDIKATLGQCWAACHREAKCNHMHSKLTCFDFLLVHET